ncbi:MAG TPA: hypothetical protein PLK94_13745 [Alphaproteobacteria bacterium]|nr:hypothetical protein [Alphaproteobacteria bacterium]HOO52342.1 hypothetical protein [Alphaproteobacteria bacterium]
MSATTPKKARETGAIVFIPGLQGKMALEIGAPAPTWSNETLVQNIAHAASWDFYKASYQSAAHPNPLLSEMQSSVALQIDRIFEAYSDRPMIICASSFGFGVMAGALTRLKSSCSRLAILGYKPVLDPIVVIDSILKDLSDRNEPLARFIRAGFQNYELPVANDYTGLADYFDVTSRHLNDLSAVCVAKWPTHAERLSNAIAGRNGSSTLRQSVMVFGTNDPLSPEPLMKKFQTIVGGSDCKLVAVEGGHNDNFQPQLRRELCKLIASSTQPR